MNQKRPFLRMLTLLGLVVGVLILTMAMLTFVQAKESAASITIVKEADQMVVRGSSASFSIDVSNTGDVTLTNVTVSDAQVPNCNRVFAELPSEEHQSYSCAVAGVTDDFEQRDGHRHDTGGRGGDPQRYGLRRRDRSGYPNRQDA